MFKHVRRALVVVSAITFAGMTAMTGSADAGPVLLPPMVETPTVRIGGDTFTSLSADFKAGDCTQYANVSRVQLREPDTAGNSTMVWFAEASTRKTSNADIWHGYYIFEDATGNQVLNTGQVKVLDGDRMTEINKVYSWSRSLPVRINLASYQRIAKVVWVASC